MENDDEKWIPRDDLALAAASILIF